MSNQTEFTTGMYTFGICANGDVSLECNDDSFFNSMVPAETFKQLAEAQRNVVWAAQHWTSLAQVSDALASLLALYPQVHCVEVYSSEEHDGPVREVAGIYYTAILDILPGPGRRTDRRTVSSVSAVQDLMRELGGLAK